MIACSGTAMPGVQALPSLDDSHVAGLAQSPLPARAAPRSTCSSTFDLRVMVPERKVLPAGRSTVPPPQEMTSA